jgi:hypothetical protein
LLQQRAGFPVELQQRHFLRLRDFARRDQILAMRVAQRLAVGIKNIAYDRRGEDRRGLMGARLLHAVRQVFLKSAKWLRVPAHVRLAVVMSKLDQDEIARLQPIEDLLPASLVAKAFAALPGRGAVLHAELIFVEIRLQHLTPAARGSGWNQRLRGHRRVAREVKRVQLFRRRRLFSRGRAGEEIERKQQQHEPNQTQAQM